MSKNICKGLEERILIQLIKAHRLLKEEHYNENTLKPIENLVVEIKKRMNVAYVQIKDGTIVYNPEQTQ